MAAAKIQKLGPNQRKWLKALEGGKFKQGKDCLLNRVGGYCCLGVAAKIFKPKNAEVTKEIGGRTAFDGESATAPNYVVDALRLHGNSGDAAGAEKDLTVLNDRGRSFKEISALIKKDPAEYFKAPK